MALWTVSFVLGTTFGAAAGLWLAALLQASRDVTPIMSQSDGFSTRRPASFESARTG